MDLMVHQREIIDLCLSQRATLVAAGIGAGKTAIGIGCLDPTKTCLVVVPASLKANWIDEIKMWKPLWNVQSARDDIPPEPGIHVGSYGDLQHIWCWQYDVVVVDEAHYAKNPLAKRTVRLSKLLDAAQRVVLMTATPALNNVRETQQLLRLMGYSSMPDDPLGLNRFMVDKHVMARVQLQDIYDIEDPEFCQINVELSSIDKILELTNELRDMYAAVGSDFGKLWDGYRPILVGKLTQIRRHIGIAKLAGAATQIDIQLKAGRKLIVFAHHRTVLESLSKTFDAPLLYGKTSLAKRHEIVKEFQEGKHPLIVCSIQAAGVGITLTKSHYVMFVEFSWTPAEYDQAYGRAHRKGQNDRVHVIDLVADCALDRRHIELLTYKRQICDAIADGDPLATRSTMQKSLLQTILEAA